MTSLDRKSSSVSETELGVGGTCAWTLGGLDASSTLSLYFEIVNQNAEPPAGPQGNEQPRQCYMQFVTKGQHTRRAQAGFTLACDFGGLVLTGVRTVLCGCF